MAEKTKHHIEAMQAKFGLMHKAHKAEKTQEISSKFMKQLGKVVARYLDIHAALAGDDTEAALGAASQALEALANVDMNLVTGKDHTGWMEHMRKLTSLLKAVSGAEGIEPARAKFALLSEQMTATLKRFGVPEGTLYKAWCPMAFDNRGAWWIQGREQISNPYFGATMLRCGEIKEVLK